MKKIKLNVIGMHCSSCAVLVKDSLDEAEGVKKTVVSDKQGYAEIEFDESKIHEHKLKEIIRNEGYEVE